MASRRARGSGSIALNDTLLRRWPLPVPGADGDKEDRGEALLVGGSFAMPGAIALSAIATLRAGAGKLTIATTARAAPLVAQSVFEARVLGIPETGGDSFARGGARLLPYEARAMLIGPGMKVNAQNRAFAVAVLERCRDVSIVLDAGAMDAIDEFRRRAAPRGAAAGRAAVLPPTIVLTPHAGELAHLTGTDKEQILGNPERAALDAARRWSAVVALKGRITFIASPDGRLWRHEGGNVGLATSGSGDVLSGLIAGLAARGATVEQAAAWGVVLHARSGDALAARYGKLGYLAREIAAEVPAIMQDLEKTPRRSRPKTVA